VSAARGRVILVGAGPGDPGLITLRGAEALREADAVLYDELVAPELLALAPPGAERINVGRRGHEDPARSQDDISAMLVRLAREGRSVVRLKGGDPFVFGRGGEEASALAAAGVAFEVVPGVSAAIAGPAFAGIPVTDRRHAASFAVVTGHKDPSQPAESIRWEVLARGTDTLVILMGMRRLPEITRRLLAERAPDTPAAAVHWAGTPRQRVVEAPLGELAARVEQAGIGAPSVVVIGDVVRLRRELAWFDNGPLFGKRVLVTRAAEQAGPLADALRRAGAEPRLLPLLRFAPPTSSVAIDAALADLASYDALLFTSANAVRWSAARARELGKDLAAFRGRVMCVGLASADAARRAGLAPAPVPSERFDAEALLEQVLASLVVEGRRILLPRAEAGRDLLPDGLRRAGAAVDAPAAYRTLAPPADGEEARTLCDWLARGELDVLTFTSPSAVRHFFALAGEAGRAAAARCTRVAIGRTTADALVRERAPAHVVPERAGARELVDALLRHAAAEAAGGGR
jgi:uroporphyrinogen III methyltransferase/synthase